MNRAVAGDRRHSVASCPDRLRRGAGSRVRLPPPRGGAARGSPSTAGALRACCKAVLAAVLGADGGPACLCHLIRRPGLFGFPVNASRIAALFSSCSAFGPPVAADSFTAFCRGQRNPSLLLVSRISCMFWIKANAITLFFCSPTCVSVTSFCFGFFMFLFSSFCPSGSFRSVFSCFMFLSFAFRVSLSSDVFCFLVLGNVAEARALPPLRSNTSTTLTEPGIYASLSPTISAVCLLV